MPEIQLGTSSKKRQTQWMPVIRAVNMLVEKDETNPFGGVTHIQRPGEVLFADLNAGPVRGLFRQAGTLSGDFLAISDEQLYRVNDIGAKTLVGALPGSLRVSVAATSTRVIIASDTVAYSTTGASVTTVVMPDSRPVGSVAQLNGYFILTEENSARFYWIEPGQTNPDGLSFATTESTPGDNLKVSRVGDELWFTKNEGTEVWVPTGDADLPFQRVPGRNYDKGGRARDAIALFDNSLAWVGNDGIVYRGDQAPVRISDHALEEQIRKADLSSMSMWSFPFDGHSVLCLSLSTGTYALDASSGQWSEMQTYGLDTWRCHVGDLGEAFVVAGSSEDGKLYRLDPEVSNDAGLPMTRKMTGGVPAVGQPQRINSLDLYAVSGTATDPNLYPKVRISLSYDLQTYDDWQDVSLSRQGHYGEPIRLNRLGLVRYPGALIQFQVTDDVKWVVQGASYNEPSR